MKTIVVIPTYNEADNLPRMAEALLALPSESLELIVVDDASPDGTGEIAAQLAERYPRRIHLIRRAGKMGLGTAYVAGFTLALEQGAEAIIQMDADFSHPPKDVLRLLSAMENHDVAVGSRYAPGGVLDTDWSWERRFLSWGANTYTRAILGLRQKDSTAGFKCFRRQALEALGLGAIRSSGYAFQIEMAYLCQKMGFRMVEIPIRFSERARGKSKMSRRIVWEAAWRVWELRLRGR